MNNALSLAVGQAVQVHAFGHWYPGVVTKLGRTRATIQYTTRVTKKTYTKTVSFVPKDYTIGQETYTWVGIRTEVQS